MKFGIFDGLLSLNPATWLSKVRKVKGVRGCRLRVCGYFFWLVAKLRFWALGLIERAELLFNFAYFS